MPTSHVENFVCRAQRVQLDNRWQPRALVHKRSVHVPSRESAQTTKNTKPQYVQYNANMETRQDDRIGKRTLKHNENTTDGHARCNVRGNGDSLENESGSSLSFVFLVRVVPDNCTKIT